MKFKHLLLASATGLFFASGSVYAQGVSKYGCYTDEQTLELEKQYPGQKANQMALETQIRQWIDQHGANLRQAGPVRKIPVVVHVVTERGLAGISKAQVLNGIQVLNEDFRRTNADTTQIRPVFKKFGADLEVEFVMARKDPQGNPTDGIVRVTSLMTNGPINRNDVKTAAPSWPTDKYFNIWLVNSINSSGSGLGTILGYAQFPGTGSWSEYGLVMLHPQWGKQGAVPGSTANSNGRTATHEVGHCFNLYHTFQGGCGSSCDNSGDLVCDTPPAQAATFGCNLNHNTCANDATGPSPYLTNVNDQLENYMSYDDCQMMFTQGQRVRAQAVLNTIPQLVNLASAGNATFTGIDPAVVVGPLRPKAYFGLNIDRVCEGSSVTFTNETYDGVATSYNWSFPGGTPSTSTTANPTVTYSTPGKYDVTLTATNAIGQTTYTASKLVNVIPTTNLPQVAPQNQFVEDFEDAAFPDNPQPNRSFEVTTKNNFTPAASFERTQVVSTSGLSSVRLRNGNIPAGTVSSLITPNIDASGTSGSLFLSFDLAYALKSTTTSENLKVFISSDCGVSWQIRLSKTGAALATNGGATVNSFIPTASQWRKETVSLPSNFFPGGKFMIKFEVDNNGGNTLYIDNLKIYTLLGANEELAQKNINVYPNPVTSETGISFDLKTPEKVSVKIFDLIGNTVYEGKEAGFGTGSHNLPLYDKMKNLKAGMYMVLVKFGNKTYNTKLITQ